MTPTVRSGLTFNVSLIKLANSTTTASLRSMGVPVGSSNSAVKVGRSLGGKKMTGK